MSLILSGTDGLSDVDGTAATPAIRGTDANTGIFFPAADTIGFSEGGAEAARFDSSGNFGIGTTSTPTGSSASSRFITVAGSGDGVLQLTRTSATAGGGAIASAAGAGMLFYTHTGTVGSETYTERARIDSSGNLAVGISSGYRTAASYTAFALNNTTGSLIDLYANSTRVGGIAGTSGQVVVSSITSIPLVFSTADTERARIDSSGNLLVGGTTQLGKLTVETTTAGTYTGYNRNTNATPGAAVVNLSIFSAASPNNTTAGFYFASDNIGAKAIIYSNGGLHNYSANNVNLSDRREKTNFAPATSYLDKICAIPVQTFNYIDQNMEDDGGLTLGVVAQDVQEVAPELVMESNWAGKDEEPKMRLSIYQTDLQYALMKCIQEQQALITTLTARITALESA